MRRRQFALRLAALASLSVLPLGRLAAQDAGRLPKVAFLLPDAPDDVRILSSVPGPRILLAGLAELGYVDRQNVLFEFGFASHALKRLPALAAELVAERPTCCTPIHRAARGPPRAQP
jgi:hypothetical protein